MIKMDLAFAWPWEYSRDNLPFQRSRHNFDAISAISIKILRPRNRGCSILQTLQVIRPTSLDQHDLETTKLPQVRLSAHSSPRTSCPWCLGHPLNSSENLRRALPLPQSKTSPRHTVRPSPLLSQAPQHISQHISGFLVFSQKI